MMPFANDQAIPLSIDANPLCLAPWCSLIDTNPRAWRRLHWCRFMFTALHPSFDPRPFDIIFSADDERN